MPAMTHSGTDFGDYDPVTALVEGQATGEVAEIFADIRATMGIPLVTSIWRGLAGVEGALPAVWHAVKPLYRTGAPEAALDALCKEMPIPSLAPVSRQELKSAGVDWADLETLRSVIDVYNRSNGLNLVTLSALISSSADAPFDTSPPEAAPEWPELPVLLEAEEISGETWDVLRELNCLGPDTPCAVATLWRHIAHWPGFLTLVLHRTHNSRRDGDLAALARQTVDCGAAQGARMSRAVALGAETPPQAHRMITDYVSDPGQVARMVSIGFGLASWLERAD